ELQSIVAPSPAFRQTGLGFHCFRINANEALEHRHQRDHVLGLHCRVSILNATPLNEESKFTTGFRIAIRGATAHDVDCMIRYWLWGRCWRWWHRRSRRCYW